MHRKRPTLFIFFSTVLLFAMLAPAAWADSTIHGSVYDWSTFEAIGVAVVEINTTPVQKVVTTNGSYAFSLPGGDYAIIAEARSASGPLSARENITVPDSGDFVIDLLLFPADDLSILKSLNESLPTTGAGVTADPGAQDRALPALAALAIALLAAAGGAYLLMNKRVPLAETPAPPEAEAAITGPAAPVSVGAASQVLRQDCKDVLTAIAKNGGRMAQLDLRRSLPYSEVKISLIASELEAAGLIRKVKKGRGNVLILTRTGLEKETFEKPALDEKEKEG